MTRARPEAARLFRIDHADEVPPEEAQRLARLGMTVCAEPAMSPSGAQRTPSRCGPCWTPASPLGIGTDWVGHHAPARPLAPLESMRLAIAARRLRHRRADYRTQALHAYTPGSPPPRAQAEARAPSSPASSRTSFLSADSAQVAPDKIDELEVLLTIAGGRVVYRQGSFGLPARQGPAAAHNATSRAGPPPPR